MKPNLHPATKFQPDCMSHEEIRYWMNELNTNPRYGWAGHPRALGRAIGFHDVNPAGTMRGKICGRCWIYPSEQPRLTRKIRAILAGEIVRRQRTKTTFDAVLADRPVPLRLPARLRVCLETGKLERVQISLKRPATLPSFADVLASAPKWGFNGRIR